MNILCRGYISLTLAGPSHSEAEIQECSMTLEERVTDLEKAVTCIENKNQEDVTAFVDKIIQEMRQSSVFSQLLEKPRGD